MYQKYVDAEVLFSKSDEQILTNLHQGDTLQRRGAEIFQMLLLRKDFKSLVHNVREKIGIYPNAKPTGDRKRIPDDAKRYLQSGYVADGHVYPRRFILPAPWDREITDYSQHAIHPIVTEHEDGVDSNLIRIYKDTFAISATNIIVTEYILLADVMMIGCEVGSIGYEERPGESEREIVVRLMASTTHEEFEEFVRNNWKSIQVIKQKILDKKSKERKKPYTNFIVDVLVYNAYIKNVQKLPSERSSPSGYLELSTSNDLKLQGIEIKSGAIPSIVARIRQKMKLANRPPSLI